LFICWLYSGDCASSPDKLVVRDGDDQRSALLAVLCGTRNSETVSSTGEALSVELVTDSARQRQGFAATFSFVDAASITIPAGGGHRPPTSSTTAAAPALAGSNGSADQLGGWARPR